MPLKREKASDEAEAIKRIYEFQECPIWDNWRIEFLEVTHIM